MTWPTVPTLSAGETSTLSTKFNLLRDALKAIGDPWTAYTPVLTATTTNPALGTGGTITGGYVAADHLIHFKAEVVFGAAGLSAGTGTYEITLPVTASESNYPVGWLIVRTSGGGRTMGQVWAQSTTLMRGAMTADDALLSATTIAWATGDRFNISGTYERA